MITTNRLISLDAVARDGKDLIHLTGPLQVVARTDVDPPDGLATQVDLRFAAAPGTHAVGGRGVDLKTGARYWVEGVHQSQHQPGSSPRPLTS
jgi:hypothetical protein